MPLSNEQLTEMYRLMLRVRLFEEGVAPYRGTVQPAPGGRLAPQRGPDQGGVQAQV